MKIWSIIINETDDTPCLFSKSFKTREEAVEKALELGREYVEDRKEEWPNLYFNEEELSVNDEDFPFIQYEIEWTKIDI